MKGHASGEMTVSSRGGQISFWESFNLDESLS